MATLARDGRHFAIEFNDQADAALRAEKIEEPRHSSHVDSTLDM